MAQSKESMFFTIPRSSTKFPVLHTPWPSGRHTPYSKTPKTGRSSRIPTKSVDRSGGASLKDSTNLTPPIINKDNACSKQTPKTTQRTERELINITEDIKSVPGKTWRVHCCSPLFNFSYANSSLQSYQKLLSSHLEAESARELAFEVEQQHLTGKFKADFSILKDFVLYDTDSRGLKITIATNTNSKKAGKHTPIFTALLCCFGRELEDSEILKRNFVPLPVCLIKGYVTLTKGVISWLEAQFDCRITPMGFSPVELGWYASLWAGTVPTGTSHNIELCYSVPSTVMGLSRVVFGVNANDARELWECNHSNNSSIFTEEESITFMKALESHFYHHFKIELASLSLSRVGTSLVFIGSEGRLKILQAEYVQHILQQITILATEREAYGKL